MDYPSVMAMPLRTFWSFQKQIGRLRAEEDIRKMEVAIATNPESGEASKMLFSRLQQELGSPIEKEAVFDINQFRTLQAKYSPKLIADDTNAQGAQKK